jgi:LysR family transcriptional regulator, regulator for metE and metH
MLALELRHHQLIAALAQEGSLVGATRVLHLTPSALSHQLRDAEDRLGVALFQRRNRRLVPTAAGEKLLESSRVVLAEAARAEAEVRGKPEDVIRLSTGCYTAYPWLAAVLRSFQPRHPSVEVRIVLEATRRPVEALLRGELDLALTSDLHASGGARLRVFPLFADELVLLAPRDHPLAARGRVRAEDLRDEHVIVYDAPREDLDVFTKVLWPAGVEPRKVSRVPLTEAMIELVRAGIGVAVLPGWAVAGETSLASLRFATLGMRRKWRAVVQRSRASWTPLQDLVRDLQVQGARQIAERARAS